MIRAGNHWIKEDTIDCIYIEKCKNNIWKVWQVYISCPCGTFEYKAFEEINDAIDCANILAHKLMGEELVL